MCACVCACMLLYILICLFLFDSLGWLVGWYFGFSWFFLIPFDPAAKFFKNVFFPPFPINTYYRNQSIHGKYQRTMETITTTQTHWYALLDLYCAPKQRYNDFGRRLYVCVIYERMRKKDFHLSLLWLVRRQLDESELGLGIISVMK